METVLTAPQMLFNPVTLDGMQVSPIQQIQLRVGKRYADINYTDKIISFYVELIDSNGNILLVPVKYYVWLSIAFTNTVICDYVKISDVGKNYNLVEITDLKKANIDIVDKVDEPFLESNYKIPESYCREYIEDCIVKRVLNNVRPGMLYSMCTGYINDNKTYVRGIALLEDLFNDTALYSLSYRKLIVRGDEFVCDVIAKRRG